MARDPADQTTFTVTSERLAELGRKGGLSKSERKRASSRENIKKATEARRLRKQKEALNAE